MDQSGRSGTRNGVLWTLGPPIHVVYTIIREAGHWHCRIAQNEELQAQSLVDCYQRVLRPGGYHEHVRLRNCRASAGSEEFPSSKFHLIAFYRVSGVCVLGMLCEHQTILWIPLRVCSHLPFRRGLIENR